jgi:hypothetical protein
MVDPCYAGGEHPDKNLGYLGEWRERSISAIRKSIEGSKSALISIVERGNNVKGAFRSTPR